jgi:hypothetical protein
MDYRDARKQAAVVLETPIVAREGIRGEGGREEAEGGAGKLPYTYTQARARAAAFIVAQDGVLTVQVEALHALVKSMTRPSVYLWLCLSWLCRSAWEHLS